MSAAGEYERRFREAGLGDDPEIVIDDDETRVERDRLGVRVISGARELVLWPGISDVRVAAYVDGEPAVVTGEAATRRVADRLALAGQLSGAEHGGRVGGAQRTWLRMLEAGLAMLEGRRQRAWSVGLPPPSERSVADYVCFPLVRSGLDSMFLAHRSRGKTTLMLAVELSLLAGVEVVPGLPPISPVDAVVHVNYENGTDLVHESMRSIATGFGDDIGGVLTRWALVGQSGTPRIDRLAELVADIVAETFPDATSLLLDVDSAEAAIATLGGDGTGDSWGARASALFNAYADVRRLLPDVVVSTLTTDHGDVKNPGLIDDVETFERMGAYGSRRKADLARAVHTLGAFGTREEVAKSAAVRELMIGTAKPWPDRQVAEPIAIEAWYDSDTGHVAFVRGKRRERTYPDGIMTASRGARLVDVMRDALVEQDRTWWSIVDLVAALGGVDRSKFLDQRIRETLRRHPRAFVTGSAGWRLSGSVR